MKISEQTKIILQQNIHIQELDGEAVLLNLNNNQYYSLDKTSLRMFRVLTSAESLNAALDILVHEYKVEMSQLQADVIEFAESLLNAGLVQIDHE